MKIEEIEKEWEEKKSEIRNSETFLNSYLNNSEKYEASELLELQNQAIEDLDDLVDEETDRPDLYFTHSPSQFVKGGANLIKTQENLDLLYEALYHKKFTLELLYRATRDGFKCEIFH